MLGSGHDLDESTYQSWTVNQAIIWANSQLSQNVENNGLFFRTQTQGGIFRTSNSCESEFNEDREDEYHHQQSRQTTIAALRKQRIDGRSFGYLTLDNLLNFGIPYGSAVRLITCLDELIPDRCALDEENSENLPSWYARNGGFAKNNGTSHTGEQDNIAMEEAQQRMKEKFGITLPTLRNQNALNQQHGDKEAQAGFCNQKQNCLGERAAEPDILSVSDDSTFDENYMPSSSLLKDQHPTLEAILDSMPPQVRAVAERRPDLVSELLQEKQRLLPGQLLPQHRPTPGHLSTLTEEDDEYQPEEAIDIDSESVGLLRRRAHNK